MMLGDKISPIFIQEVRGNILQVNDFQKVNFVHHFIKAFERKLYTQYWCVEKSVKFFDEMVNKRDFLKIINLQTKIRLRGCIGAKNCERKRQKK